MAREALSAGAVMATAWLWACQPVPAPGGVSGSTSSTADTALGGTTSVGTSSSETCGELGNWCDPIQVGAMPWSDRRDTRDSAWREVDSYSCAPDTDEGGPELWYVVTLTEAGLLTAGVDDVSGDDLDVDIHLLADTDPSRCIARDNVALAARLDPGTYYLVVDTWVDADGQEKAGRYELVVDFVASSTGDCEVVPTDVEMFWTSCEVAGCYQSGGKTYLQTPVVGPVVKEAHLVTTSDNFGGGWPSSFTDGLSEHYLMSEGVSGYAAARTEPWAPSGEGGSRYGQGATGAPIPPEAEAWYINMYWRSRPAPGTPMIVRNPANGRAVVAAAGYETGPGSNTSIAGVVEEVHLYLGTGHRDALEIGFAADTTLPFGPITCD